MVKCYMRKNDVTKLLKKLGSNEKYDGTSFKFEGCKYEGEVRNSNGLYLIRYNEI